MEDQRARLALAGAVLLQAASALAVALKLLGLLREIIDDPGRWSWVSLLAWLIFCAPLLGLAVRMLAGSRALWRGDLAEWRSSLLVWTMLLVAAVINLARGILGGYDLLWFAIDLAMLTLLGLGRKAVR